MSNLKGQFIRNINYIRDKYKRDINFTILDKDCIWISLNGFDIMMARNWSQALDCITFIENMYYHKLIKED